MKYIGMCCLLLLMACGSQEPQQEEKSASQKFYVGTYTDQDSKGIYQYELSPEGSMTQLGLLAESENPSFLAKSADGRFLVAVNEISDENAHGSVESYAIDDDSLVLISRKSSGGAHPCFVALNEEGYVLAANYSGGNMALLKINESGELEELDLEIHEGQGSSPRQKSSHVHSAWFSPWNKHVISVDLGTNELWFSKIEEGKLMALDFQKLAMEEGAGPRHLCFHPHEKWLYVLNELNGMVTQVGFSNDEKYQILSNTSSLLNDLEGDIYAADIHISSDGRFVYSSIRGGNHIAVFEVNQENGNLKLLANTPTQGDWPRNFCFSPNENHVLVAHQYSNDIVCFKRHPETGMLEFASKIEAPSPVCLLF